MPDSYAKSWCSKFDDPWYKGLKLNERGLFDQLFVWAKRCGDTGWITFKNYTEMGVTFGTNCKTCGKIVELFLRFGKLEAHPQEKVLVFFIVNYKEYQRDRVSGTADSPAKVQKKFRTKKRREEKRKGGEIKIEL